MDEKEFFRLYQEIKFQEDSSDCFSVAATKRKTLALNFYGSIYFKESNSVTEFLLYEDMMEYGEIVDKTGSGNVNNYADGVLALLSNQQNDDRKNWESHLDEIDLKDYLEPLPCSNNINCINSDECIEESIAELKTIFQTQDEVEPVKSFKNTKPTVMSTIGNHHQSKSNELDKGNFFLNNRKMIEKRKEETIVEEEPSYNKRQDKGKFFLNSRKVMEQRNEEMIVEEEPSPNEDRKANCLNAFRTARDELHIQNAKKFGKGDTSGGTKGYGVGTNKKCLGTRKGGVFGKFQPPTKNKDSKDEKQNTVTTMEVDEPVDERLKNIDPAMIELIKNEIMNTGPKITWTDIAGLNLAKTTIQEIVVWPMLRPDIFTGLRRPPKGILLFGPPGTGKTLIGKCIASQSNSTFFSISASSLTSKWVGDGEKMVRTLFAVAKVYQPSVVFIDEIDSLLSQRSDSEHECSRRIKTEFLVQLDGAGTGDEDRILIIGATNRPQELDEAARRRLVKRLYIPLPDKEARKQIVENLISSERHCLTDAEIENIAQLTDGYSGADVKNLCQEASLGPIRSITPSMIQCINPSDVRPVNSKDFESALCRIKSSVSEKDLEVYVKWDKQYGCGSAFT